jgi:tRNA-dihydrouridine synthase
MRDFKGFKFSVAPMTDWTDRHCRVFHRLMTRRSLLYTEMLTTPDLRLAGQLSGLRKGPGI